MHVIDWLLVASGHISGKMKFYKFFVDFNAYLSVLFLPGSAEADVG